MNYLQIVQRAARDSGVISGLNQPPTTVGQTGLLGKLVGWVSDGWVDIQNERNAWRFMRKEFSSAQTIPGTARYTAASWNLTDFAEWRIDRPWVDEKPVSIYDPTIGVADEQTLRFIEFEYWDRWFNRGQQTNQRPQFWSISPANEFCFGPIPDIVYTVHGWYRRTAQVLAADTDVPICPERFHDLLVRKGLIKLGEYDEAAFAITTAQASYMNTMFAMERDQLPRIVVNSGPLA